MHRLLKWAAMAGLVLYLALGEGALPSTTQALWHSADRAASRAALRWSLRLYAHPTSAALGEQAIDLLWQIADDHEKEVMRRYLALRTQMQQ